ncbi:MAG: hypothetical protein AMJ90_02030 [candidate division Zixibacteria bacterium SM23_73_2]|nr:MAG: hypothetical protein AMJ90_02030 [candidate division Zixibacteria bacterium SM23_73_2]
MTAFKGTYKYSVDEKGRVNIPAKFRKSTSSTTHDVFVLTRGLEGCLFVYPVEEWEKVEEKLKRLEFTQKKTRLFERHLLPNASDAVLDRQGRITIPTNLLEFARIKKEVLILGVLERIEIWDPEIYNQYLASAEKTYEEIAEELFRPEE